MSLETPNSAEKYSNKTSSSSWFRPTQIKTSGITNGPLSQTNGDSIAILGSSCQANSKDAARLHQKSVECAKRPCGCLRRRDPKEAVRGSDTLLKPSVIPTTTHSCRGRVWFPSSSRGSDNPLQRGCLY